MKKKLFIEKKAQSSFEMIIIVAVVITISLSTLFRLPALAASASTFAIMRGEALKEFSKYSDFYFIVVTNFEGNWEDRNGVVNIYVGGSHIATQLESDLIAKKSILNDMNLCDGCTVRVYQGGI